MVEAQTPRLLESVVMLPILHAKAGPLKVAAVGPMAEDMAAEALRWRDVEVLYLQGPTKVLKDRRIKQAVPLPRGEIDVLLLSPEQDPKLWLPALARGGVINPTTAFPEKWGRLREFLASSFGTSTPWRNWLPRPIYGVLGQNAPGKVQRRRRPPKGARHLSEQYLPCLFTFARDELPVALTRVGVRIANQPGSSHEPTRKNRDA